FVDQPTDQWQELLVSGFAVRAAGGRRPVNGLTQMGSGHAQPHSECLLRKASFGGDASCKLGFFACALARASLRISTSMVLRPRRRSSSRIRSSRRPTSEFPPTGSSEPTAAAPPCAIKRRHR